MLDPFPDAPPLPAGTPLWRYMDFTQFVDLLAHRHLYFVRPDRLDDPFEGARTRAEAAAAGDGPYARAGGGPAVRRYAYVNCWYAGRHESLAMWRIYCRSPEGVAVRSSPARLAAALRADPRPVQIGRVRYADYDRPDAPAADGLPALFRKRPGFAFEREVRLLHFDRPAHAAGRPAGPPGLRLAVDLGELVRDVVLAPSAEPWLLDLVRTVADRFGVRAVVRRSRLETGPVYG